KTIYHQTTCNLTNTKCVSLKGRLQRRDHSGVHPTNNYPSCPGQQSLHHCNDLCNFFGFPKDDFGDSFPLFTARISTSFDKRQTMRWWSALCWILRGIGICLLTPLRLMAVLL